jgi:small-conductance mechanosensitive channel
MKQIEKLLQWQVPETGTPAGTLLALAQLLLVYLVLRFLLNNIVGRIVVPLASRETSGARKERAARLHTLAGVVRSTGNYVLTFIIVLVALKKFGVDTTPVLASASVVGLAVGFGSQKLVRDVTTGFFLLAESQFDVGDYVTISGITGTVEEVGMRTTRLRDDAGKLYILSNGDISTVCNHSAGLVNLFLDFAVPATEDLDRVRAVVETTAERLSNEYGESLLERPRVEGITAMTAAQVTLRVCYRATARLQERIQMRLREVLREELARAGISLA